MVTPASSRTPREDAHEERAQPPIRWARPAGDTLALVGLWAVGLIVALFIPAAIVPPSVRTAPERDVWIAFTITIVGAFVMIVAALILYRRKQDAAWLIMGGVPATVTIVGAAILAASKLTGL
jgi:hypothetical protein